MTKIAITLRNYSKDKLQYTAIAIITILALSALTAIPQTRPAEAATCPINNPPNCYADVRLTFGTAQKPNGGTGFWYVNNPTVTIFKVNYVIWAPLTDGKLVETGWTKGVNTGKKFYAAWDGGSPYDWYSPETPTNGQHSFQLDDTDLNGFWRAAIDGSYRWTAPFAAAQTALYLEAGFESLDNTNQPIPITDYDYLRYAYASPGSVTWYTWVDRTSTGGQPREALKQDPPYWIFECTYHPDYHFHLGTGTKDIC